MARLPRYRLPGQPQHITQRGVDRTAMFAAPVDYHCFHQCLGMSCEKYECDLHAYVLMTNHVHLLMTPKRDESISRVMQAVGRRYVRYFNDAYGRTGALWEGRYRATVVDSGHHLLNCYRYIELNPVRASLAARPSEYAWSSHLANALGEPDPIIRPHALYQALGTEDRGRRAAYRALFRAELEEPTLGAIRVATENGWALGDDRFRREVAALLGRRSYPLPPGPSQKWRHRGQTPAPKTPIPEPGARLGV